MALHAGLTVVMATITLSLVHRVTDRADADTPLALLQAYETMLLGAAVVWLVSDANPSANGQKINIDGGNF
jgi:hypothetical protein